MDQAGHERTALVLYASETGTAQDAANDVGRMLERLHLVTEVAPLDAVDPPALAAPSLVIVVASTTGQGDLPTNARLFWRSILRKKLPPTYLENVRFTSFGLGDSSYPKFNFAIRKLHKRFIQLGATEIYPRGEADEQNQEGIDATLIPWLVDLRRHLIETFPLTKDVHPIPEDVPLPPKWTLTLDDSTRIESNSFKSNGVTNGIYDNDFPRGWDREGTEPLKSIENEVSDLAENGLSVCLEENKRVTSDTHWQDVRQLVFSTSTTVNYEQGDVLTVHPKNSAEYVTQLLDLMNWIGIADETVRFLHLKQASIAGVSQGFPLSNLSQSNKITLRALLTDHLDITAIPRRSFFSMIAQFTKDQTQKERLLEFTNPEYVDELYDYTTRPRRSILEVLQEFDTVKIPWPWAATVFPELRGRQFSIASGGKLKISSDGLTRFDLLVAIVKYKTVIKKVREGVCTRYLASLPVGTTIRVNFQKGSLGITSSDTRRPVIMVGPGTGIAPMRSLIWERLQSAENLRAPNGTGNHDIEKSDLSKSVLFFGCRSREADYFYQHEWSELTKTMPLQVFTAFSRDQRHKIYVQDLIREQSQLIFNLLYECGGLIYICGSSGRMPQAVREALIEVFQTGGKMDRTLAEAYLVAMEKGGRYKQETW